MRLSSDEQLGPIFVQHGRGHAPKHGYSIGQDLFSPGEGDDGSELAAAERAFLAG